MRSTDQVREHICGRCLTVAKEMVRCRSLGPYSGDGRLSGDLATDMPAHSIRDGPDTRLIADSERVLVNGAHKADLAPTYADPGTHREYAASKVVGNEEGPNHDTMLS
jgi:hypothetical protein